MANIKISDMTRATSVGGSDLLPIVQGGESKSIEYKNINKHSTTEQVIGTWIDEKPLYRKVIILNDEAPNIDESILSSLDIRYLIRAEWILWSGSVFSKILIDYNALTKKITNKPSSGWSYCLIVEYTKTTD